MKIAICDSYRGFTWTPIMMNAIGKDSEFEWYDLGDSWHESENKARSDERLIDLLENDPYNEELDWVDWKIVEIPDNATDYKVWIREDDSEYVVFVVDGKIDVAF